MKRRKSMFFKLNKSQTVVQADVYEQIRELVTTALLYEIPEHSPHHHILFTANQKLEQYRQAAEYFRLQSDVSTTLGQFSIDAYTQALQQFNQLQLLIRGFIHLSDDGRRVHFNHHFRFYKEQIDKMYTQYKEQKVYSSLLQLEMAFHKALKEDLLPFLTQLD